MNWLARLSRSFRTLLHLKRAEQDLDDEVRFHLEMQVEANIAAGMSPEDARYDALRTFGGVDQAKEQCRDVRPFAFLDAIIQDLRFGIRQFRKSPGFTAVVVLTLGLGIGATTSVFSVVNAVLLKPPPYPEPHRILVLSSTGRDNQSGQIFHYVRERARSFERIAAHGIPSGWNLVFENRAEYVAGLPVSEGFFDTLGVGPALGRSFHTLEDQPNGPRAIVLSDALWRRMFGGRPEAVGEVVLLGGEPHTIVGIMPPGFHTLPTADVWTPLRLSPSDVSFNYTVLGRLRPDRSDAPAAAELALINSEIQRDLPDVSKYRRPALRWVSYQNWLGFFRDELLLLLGAVMLLLLIACANVTCLQLVRAESRRREMAMRSALGGGRVRLIQQVITESVLLALFGAVLGISMAHWGTRSLLTLVPTGLLEGRTVDFDWRVFAVASTIAVGAGILFGLAPALTSSRLDLRAALVGGARDTGGQSTTWLRRTFAMAETALAVLLLTGAGLLIRTFVNLHGVDLGFDPSNVVIGRMSLQGSTSQTGERLTVFLEQTLGRLREIPGVTAAAVGSNTPVEPGLNLPLEPPAGGRVNGTRAVDWRYVTAEYFSLFGIPLRTGRLIEQRDVSGSTPVVLVNEAFARTYFGGIGETLGRFVQLGANLGDAPRQIIGVVGDVKARSASGWTGGMSALGSEAPPTMYVPAAQVPDAVLQLAHRFFAISWAVRTSRGIDVITAVQQVVQSAEPRLPFMNFTTMAQVVARDIETQRFMMSLLSIFAFLSLLLAAVGVYGLFAYTAKQRTKEIGIRMALGAPKSSILKMIVGQGLKLALSGVVIGLLVSLALNRLMAGLLYGVSPTDPFTYVAVSIVMIAVAGVASYVPARRAARVDPMQALRAE